MREIEEILAKLLESGLGRGACLRGSRRGGLGRNCRDWSRGFSGDRGGHRSRGESWWWSASARASVDGVQWRSHTGRSRTRRHAGPFSGKGRRGAALDEWRVRRGEAIQGERLDLVWRQAQPQAWQSLQVGLIVDDLL